ncbi:MAG TPA: DUF4238 domain-containing protein [Pyrinomonadaceae bacterium]|jgi:hypothetical protein
MSRNKQKTVRSHIVSRFYLEGFTDPSLRDRKPKLWVYRADQEPFTRTPDHVGIVKSFYEHELSYQIDIEQQLQKMETIISPIVAKLRSGQFALDAQERAELARFIAIATTRVPSFAEATDLIGLGVYKALLKRALDDSDFLVQLVQTIEAESGEAIDSRELTNAIEAVSRGDIVVEQKSRAWTIKMMFLAAAEISQYIEAMKWILLRTTRDNWFLTSDMPVSLLDPVTPRANRAGFELSNQSTFSFPISREYCLFGSFAVSVEEKRDLRGSEVRKLNKRAIMVAHENVYAAERSDALKEIVDTIMGKRLEQVKERLRNL